MFRDMKDMRVSVIEDWATDKFVLHVRIDHFDGTKSYIDDIALRNVAARDVPDFEPNGVSLTRAAIRQLMNSLWTLGIRPSDDIASVGQAEAMADHIASLKSQVQNLQEINLELLNRLGGK
ncbi:MAG: hypothetical protein ACYS7Y_28965 [Planctomycetota bacterium]|jgi:hypothetical protein